jgi:hypothetical protein
LALIMSRWARRIVAGCEIVGGLAGTVSLFVELARLGFRPDAVLVSGYVLALFLLSLYAGVMLWRDKSVGYSASVIVQLIQFPKLVLPQFAFSMSFGFDLEVLRISHPNGLVGLGFHARFFERHLLWIGPQPGGGLLVGGFSLFSCITLWLLLTHLARGSSCRGHLSPNEEFREPSADALDNFKRLRDVMMKAKEEPDAAPGKVADEVTMAPTQANPPGT